MIEGNCKLLSLNATWPDEREAWFRANGTSQGGSLFTVQDPDTAEQCVSVSG